MAGHVVDLLLVLFGDVTRVGRDWGRWVGGVGGSGKFVKIVQVDVLAAGDR